MLYVVRCEIACSLCTSYTELEFLLIAYENERGLFDTGLSAIYQISFQET